ncbi:anaerobic ribonucleoside-triphosphate reductase activating protein [Gemelliphila palaticanis]|uniref:Anaerobic ribonucleoside-triphosphate reductase-activating protein n=1 Tax=Gemelliphila palaticanis TaxID=81950 RepID=A0ABX2T1E0_9BACL|nr:anaerobic ribonucleoside-triphosphate reductase activating protein [Gemella palaticanis]MBF0715527.1 anaerobic ribonucleoside-triphosphate reductase activating protein [Gemella palaticanis]NYS47457.1 anaerobic ribonucleoside-triphosphate reductase activating protein [Gemella palaticanis]
MSREENFKSIVKIIDMQNNKKYIQQEKIETYRTPKKSWTSQNYSKKKYSSYKPFQFVDGEGVRCSIYLSGCLFGCKECFNESIQNFNAGEYYNIQIENQIIEDLSNDYVQGLTILGGEPFLNTEVSIQLCKRIREEFGYSKDIWVYSGYTYEQLLDESSDKIELLQLCDVLVDGPFICTLKDLNLKFRGSSNQRIIDLKKSSLNNVVLYLE